MKFVDLKLGDYFVYSGKNGITWVSTIVEFIEDESEYRIQDILEFSKNGEILNCTDDDQENCNWGFSLDTTDYLDCQKYLKSSMKKLILTDIRNI